MGPWFEEFSLFSFRLYSVTFKRSSKDDRSHKLCGAAKKERKKCFLGGSHLLSREKQKESVAIHPGFPSPKLIFMLKKKKKTLASLEPSLFLISVNGNQNK